MTRICIHNTQRKFQEHFWYQTLFIWTRIFHKSNKIVTKPYLNFSVNKDLSLLCRFLLHNGTSTVTLTHIAQKMKFFIKDFFSKCDQICSFLWIWSHLLKKSLMENFHFFCSDIILVKYYPETSGNLENTCSSYALMWETY